MGKRVKIFKVEVNGQEVDAKQCTKCHEIKPLTEYGNDKSLKYRKPRCKKCTKKFNTRDKGKRAEYDKRRYENNREQINKDRRKHYKENRDHILKQKKRWREKNKDHYLETVRRYRENNDEYKKYQRDYARKEYRTKPRIAEKSKVRLRKRYRENKEAYLERNRQYNKTEKGKEILRRRDHIRRARTKETLVTMTKDDWRKCLNYFSDSCAYCGSDELIEQDHFTPLSKGGEYTSKNIVPACKVCNVKKHNYSFFDWYPIQSFYSKQREKRILKYLGYKDNQQQIALF